MSEPLVVVDKVSKHFPLTRGVLFAKSVGFVRAVDNVSFAIHSGDTIALVGESGCGKSTTASMVLQLTAPTSGVVRFDGIDINRARGEEWARYRRSVQAVFQNPYGSLNPRMRVRDIIAEPLIINTRMTKREIDQRIAEVVAQVGLPPETPGLYPHEFSGGQRQRIALARALALKPKLIVLDEPVSGLDVSMKAQVLNLLKDLQRSFGLAYLFISHSLADVRYLCDWIMVMYLGRIVESGPVEEVFASPLHSYTRALLAAALPFDGTTKDDDETIIAGEVPSPIDPPKGCGFHPRCPRAMHVCSVVQPPLRRVRPERDAACHRYDPDLASLTAGEWREHLAAKQSG